jgi:glycosyltransferase involved in cell wall biosynthesis
MALLVQPLVRRKLIFDIRGLMAEEYADAGRWTRDGAPYRLTEWIQGVGLRRADGFVVLTQRVRRKLWGEQPANVQVIPCCVDFERLAPGERDVRAELRLGDGPVMIYLGKLTGVYMDREMAVFFSVARRDRPDLTFLVVTQSPAESIVDELGRAGLQADAYRITSAPSADVGAYLAAADFAICFCHPKPSLIAASPTKVGEYLAAGLPVVSGPDVGDTDAVLSANRAGVIVERFDDESYAHASATVLQQVADGETAARCRQVAHDVFSLRDVAVPRYDALYRTLGRTR